MAVDWADLHIADLSNEQALTINPYIRVRKFEGKQQ